MTYTDAMRNEIRNTTVPKTVDVAVPDNVVDAIAHRLADNDEADEAAARDLAHEHVDTTYRYVTEDGEPVEQAALERAGFDRMDDVDVPLSDDLLEELDDASQRAGVERAAWVREAARQRLKSDGPGLTLESDDVDDSASSSEDSPDPIDVEATAQLDFGENPERPLSVELEIPAGVIDEAGLADALESVSIDARLVTEAK